MKKTILSLILALGTFVFCNAQKIEMEKVFGGYKYTQNGKLMTLKDLANTMQTNTEAFELIKKAKATNGFASVLAFTGGGLIGYPLGTAAGGGDANWTLAGIGAGILVVAIPIVKKINKNTQQAVEIYNSSLGATSYQHFNPAIDFVANANGIGFSMKF